MVCVTELAGFAYRVAAWWVGNDLAHSIDTALASGAIAAVQASRTLAIEAILCGRGAFAVLRTSLSRDTGVGLADLACGAIKVNQAGHAGLVGHQTLRLGSRAVHVFETGTLSQTLLLSTGFGGRAVLVFQTILTEVVFAVVALEAVVVTGLPWIVFTTRLTNLTSIGTVLDAGSFGWVKEVHTDTTVGAGTS